MKKTGLLRQHRSYGIVLSLFALFVLLFGSFVSAFGVSAPYWGDNPLYLSPGQTKEVVLGLQNLAGEPQDLIVEITLLDGGDIAVLQGNTTIALPFGSDNVPVPVTIFVPDTAENGDTWTVTLNFQTFVAEEVQDGTIQFNTGVQKSFDVIVPSQGGTAFQEQVAEIFNLEGESPSLLLVVVVLVVVLVLLVLLFLL